MNTQINQLTTSLTILKINKPDKEYIKKIITIQSWFRGCIYRLKHLPLIMYKIQKYLKTTNFTCATENDDGRINSCIDEPNIIKLLISKFGDRIKKPETNILPKQTKKKKTNKKKTIRTWCDILAYDYIYGWIPINIKTTTMIKNDNIGNLSTVLYAYTDNIFDLNVNKSYTNGKMSTILFNKLKNKQYNKHNKKDYYFLVLNKKNRNDIIVNSIKGLTILHSNINNLPFQVCWDKNREFYYEPIYKKIKLFITCLQKPKPIWSEQFMRDIRTLKL